jgi:hypothetical protein
VDRAVVSLLRKAGWSWGCVSAIDSNGRTIWIADAHRGDGKRFVVRADEKLTAFIELELAIRHKVNVKGESAMGLKSHRRTLQNLANSHLNPARNGWDEWSRVPGPAGEKVKFSVKCVVSEFGFQPHSFSCGA